MRFVADGPSIPDELLVSRDEGRVIFFCGAGVSRARAGLTDFLGLAQKVIDALGVAADSPIRKVMAEAREVESKTGVVGLISADRLFGLLERDFSIRDIQAAVAATLKPTSPPDLSAHRIMLDLAKGPDGKVRLVTTNFDLLFEDCDTTLPWRQPPRLPDPHRHDELEGIIHLHGRVDGNYAGADGDGFVLSSAEFGRAYLSEGWATRFIRAILARYFVVFVGYTADDPPVQYLLEALNRGPSSRPELYAFQSGSQGDAEARWLHKGVQPISYEEASNHQALWHTLAAWAVRARYPDAWYENVIAHARQGPEALVPHERGQIAHVVSTLDGMKRIALSPEPPPANWLCVFDPSVRYSRPGYLWTGETRGPYFDPFRAYGLDSDPAPTPIEPDDHYVKREVPLGVWDGLAATRLDLQSLGADGSVSFRGHWATHVPRLPARLEYLGVWLSRVSHQPAAVWWAAGQMGIHPDLQQRIRLELERAAAATVPPEIERAWRYLFEAWERQENDFDSDLYAFNRMVDREGWTTAAVRRLVLILRPYLTASRPAIGRSRPPDPGVPARIRDVVDLDVKYPVLHRELVLPDEYLRTGVRELRKNLEHAVLLETELGAYGLHMLCPIEPDLDLEGESSVRNRGISWAVLHYVRIFSRLAAINPGDAKQEYLAWPVDDEVFARLRIWVCGHPGILSVAEASQLLCRLNDRVFWNSHHQRDLMLVMAKRWADLPLANRVQLERRLLDGPPKWEDEDDAEHAKRAAWSTLSRIHWLDAHGCTFGCDLNAESAARRELVPEWQPQYAKGGAASLEPRGGWVRRDTEFASLLQVPLAAVLDEAARMSGRATEGLLERRPFAGLAAQRPVRALRALVHSAKRKIYPGWAWRTFLGSEVRRQDKPRLSGVIASRVAQLPPSALAELIQPIADYLFQASPVLLEKRPKQFDQVWSTILPVLRSGPDTAKSSILRNRGEEPDWNSEALDAPVGKLAQAVMNDPQSKGLERGNGFPPHWLRRVEELLTLDGDLRRHALVMFAFNLDWFFAIDPEWTEKNLISVLDQDGYDQDAVWAGFFWAARTPSQTNYLTLKPRLLRLARRQTVIRRPHAEVLAGILLAGWGSVDDITGRPCITDVEMREALIAADDDFRSHTLWQLERWASEDGEVGDGWQGKVVAFLTKVWPKHKRAKTAKTTAALCNLAFADEKDFPAIVDIIIPLVIQSGEEHLSLYGLEEAKDKIVNKYPEKMLALLFAVLPEAVLRWPYGIDRILEQIGIADPSLLKDPRLVELKRRWAGR